MSMVKDFTLSCPLPITDYPTVTLAHGGGGKLMHQLIEKMILPAFNNSLLETRHDGAVFDLDVTGVDGRCTVGSHPIGTFPFGREATLPGIRRCPGRLRRHAVPGRCGPNPAGARGRSQSSCSLVFQRCSVTLFKPSSKVDLRPLTRN